MSTQATPALCSQIRRDIVRMVHANNSGHPGGSLGCTELFVSLYFEVMNHNNNFTMDGKNEDIFFLSNGHISPVFYSTLARSGYFEVSELKTFIPLLDKKILKFLSLTIDFISLNSFIDFLCVFLSEIHIKLLFILKGNL